MMKQTGKLRKLNKILAKVKRYKNWMADMTDQELKEKTAEFKQKLQEGYQLEEILPEAFAVICEADYRVLGKFPYDVQILGGIALHLGYLAQMNTGEGKTLTATLPLYLNALTGKSTILVTTNEYLANRDAQEMGQVFSYMGLTVAAGVSEDGKREITNDEKREIYSSDIVYTTNGVLGFDYLLNNLVTRAEDRYMRDFYFVIVDEADSVLLDSAQTPLIISGAPKVQTNLYEMANFFVTTLKEGVDYEKKEKQVWLTEEGIIRAEKYFRISNFYSGEYFELNRYVTLALRAHALFEKGKDYTISGEKELVLLDGGSGRSLPGVKLGGGQHQALEVKEGVKVTPPTRSVASICLQNLFLLFPKLSGMSGTIASEATELKEVYGKDVVVIPANKKVIREDYGDRYFSTAQEQYKAALNEVIRVHKTGQPVLIVVSTIAQTELFSSALMEEKIPHNVLNANNAFWEAEIIKEAGRKDAVTVATSMAGRGTDIKLGKGVDQLGGLAVIGIGRMNNVRLELQARGRAGRQGDPGFSQFFVSLDDEVVAVNTDPDLLEKAKNKSQRKIKNIINEAQKLNEENALFNRRQSFEYDVVFRKQRKMIYEMRNHLLNGDAMNKDLCLEDLCLRLAEKNIAHFLSENKKPNKNQVSRYILDNLSYKIPLDFGGLQLNKIKQIKEYLLKLVLERLQSREMEFENHEVYMDFVRKSMLSAIDDAWVEQVDYLQQLQTAVSGRASTQRNMVFEYQIDAQDSYDKMEERIFVNIVRNVLLSSVSFDKNKQMTIILP